MSDAQWSVLRQGLETTGLVQVEPIPGIGPPYLKFHPTLAPALWPRLSTEEQAQWGVRHRQGYYQLSGYLYQQDDQHPHETRAIAWRELPNLLHAVQAALAAGETWAVEFADKVNRFLDYFGLNRDREALARRAAQAGGTVGSDTWYLAHSTLGEQLFSAGRYQDAEKIFTEVLQVLGDKSSYQRCVTLGRLGRCLRFQGQAAQAEACYRQGLAVAEQLEPSEGVKRERGISQGDLADVLMDRGDYQGARAAYEAALTIAKEQDDDRQIGVVEGQLGTLALLQGNLQEAEQRHREALKTFQRLQEPAMEAVAWHQLGRVYQEVRQWEPAERAYRESARIKEERGDLAGAARTWGNLAIVTESAGKPQEAEGWYRKAIDGGKAARDWLSVSKALNNLADLLQNQPDRLPEARQLAEEALAIKQTLDPAAAQIWTTYDILAEIVDKQGEAEQARTYRRQAREAYAGFAGARYALGRHVKLIAAVVDTAADPAQRADLEADLEARIKNGWGNLVAAIRQILDGERDEDALCEPLDLEDSLIVYISWPASKTLTVSSR